ncbi:MAG: hypothetical protein SGCHY_004282 [Lobulomycetales sp.]
MPILYPKPVASVGVCLLGRLLTPLVSLLRASIQCPGSPALNAFDWPHLAMTYASLISLLVLHDYSFSRIPEHVRRRVTQKFIPSLQDPVTGGFRPIPDPLCDEIDLRFVYCAAAVCFMLNDFDGMNVEKCLAYIQSCKSFDGGQVNIRFASNRDKDTAKARV